MGTLIALPQSGPQTPGASPDPRFLGRRPRRTPGGESAGLLGHARPWGAQPRQQLLFAVSLTLHFWFSSLRAPCRGVLDKPCRLWALTSESILSQMGTIDWNEKLILNQ